MQNILQEIQTFSPRRVGIVGAGLMGMWHAHTVARIGGKIVGVADPVSEQCQKISQKYGAKKFETAAEMLNGVGIDILHVCTTTSSHEAIIQAALQQDVHVFVEKPLANNLAQTQSLIALAQKNNCALCPVHQYAFQRSIETILEQRGRAGAITHVDLQFFSAGGDDAPATDHAQIAADILPHPVSILSRLFPEQPMEDLVWKVEAAARSGWEITTQIDGIIVRISISLRARPTSAALIVRGDRGSFVADLFHDYVLFREGTASRRTKMLRPFADALGHLSRASSNIIGRLARREPAYPGLQTLTRRFHSACAGTGTQPIPANDTIAAARIRDYFLDSVYPASNPEPDQ